MMAKTVNVIVIDNEFGFRVFSWKSTPKGLKNAKEYFTKVIKELGCSDDEVINYLESCEYSTTGAEVYLKYSTVLEELPV